MLPLGAMIVAIIILVCASGMTKVMDDHDPRPPGGWKPTIKEYEREEWYRDYYRQGSQRDKRDHE